VTTLLAVIAARTAAALVALGALVLALAGGLRWVRELTATPDDRAPLDARAERRARVLEVARYATLALTAALFLLALIDTGDVAARWAGLAFLATLVWAARLPTEDAFAAIVLVFGRVLAPGDWIEVRGRRGRVLRRGAFWVRLEGSDGTQWIVPNRHIVADGVVTLTRAARDTPVDVVLPIRGSLSLADAREAAGLCAASSPYASLHRRPETFLDIRDGETVPLLRVRGFVYDPAYVEIFRSHVVEAWLDVGGPADPRGA
jgi:small-conductance mechanosensitive channel